MVILLCVVVVLLQIAAFGHPDPTRARVPGVLGIRDA
jgi:hypothetical protein